MRIAVNQSPGEESGKWSWRWIEELHKRNVEAVVTDFRNPHALDEIRTCDGAMWHFGHIVPAEKQAAWKILNSIEFGLGVSLFPNLASRWHFDDKIAQHYLLDAMGAPKIPSWVFWDYREALDFTAKCRYPIVLKLAVGAGSANVLLLGSEKEANNYLRKLFGRGLAPYTMNEFSYRLFPRNRKDLGRMKARAMETMARIFHPAGTTMIRHSGVQSGYAYFQEFLPGNTHDIRVTVIGDRAFGLTRQNRPGDFRASGSGNLDFDPSKVPMETVRIAFSVSQANGFQSMCYDFLRSPDGKPLLNEMSYCSPSIGVSGCPGYWDSTLKWHERQMQPEEAHVEDFVETIKKGTAK
jgi:glutathione synthase/RimK-type ligase-like ATP-grasp enzyme